MLLAIYLSIHLSIYLSNIIWRREHLYGLTFESSLRPLQKLLSFSVLVNLMNL